MWKIKMWVYSVKTGVWMLWNSIIHPAGFIKLLEQTNKYLKQWEKK